MDPGRANPEDAAILAGPDGDLIADALRQHGIGSVICATTGEFLQAVGRQSGLAIALRSALTDVEIGALVDRIALQPDWSDFPFVILIERNDGSGRDVADGALMETLGNVTFLETPFSPTTLASLARTAVASRRRQYQARERLAAIEASRAEIERNDERLKIALAAGKLGSWELEFPDRTLRASDQCKLNFGLERDVDLTYGRLIEILHEDDRDSVVAAAQRAIDERADFEADCRFVGRDGDIRWVEVRGRASYLDGKAVRLIGVSLDVTDRKAAEERQNLLIRELHHRVKNTLATVQAIVGATARGATTIDGFHRDFTGRIMSLANTHTILTEQYWQHASLDELVAKELDMFEADRGRIDIRGPAVVLPSDYAVPLGMAFHELMTNAAKYGSLANDTGQVAVSWDIDTDETPYVVNLSWREQGGPPVKPPTRTGFGTRLLERVLTAQLKAKVRTDYAASGLTVSIAFPMPERRPDPIPET